jgi:4-hydroxymandelate oxidase
MDKGMPQEIDLASLMKLSDYEERFREHLPPGEDIYGTVGLPDWQTLTANVNGFKRVRLRPRVIRGVDHLQLSTNVLNDRIATPIMIAPPGGHTRVHPDGELATARAAGAAGTLMAVSTAAGYTVEDIAAVATGPLWFQLYYFEDRRLNERLVRRVEDAGYSALVVTVSMPPVRSFNVAWNGDVRRQSPGSEGSQWASRPDTTLRDIEVATLAGERDLLSEVPRISTFMELTKSLSWADLDWLREFTTLPLVVKGIQTAEDAQLATQHGIDGIVVSNHGGLAVEGALGSIEVLPEVVDAVGQLKEVYLDGGVRTGGDVLRALALGARAVFIGRPIFWGLALGGEAGLAHILDILQRELMRDMQWCGVTDVNGVDRSLVDLRDFNLRG